MTEWGFGLFEINNNIDIERSCDSMVFYNTNRVTEIVVTKICNIHDVIVENTVDRGEYTL